MEFEEPYARKMKSWSEWKTLTLLAYMITLIMLIDWGGLPLNLAFVVSFTAFHVVDYWIPPRPPGSFTVWTIKAIAHYVPILLVLFVISPLLSRWIWPSLAYAVPVFIIALSSYWLPPLYPVKKRDSLRKRLLISLGMAVGAGLAAHFIGPVEVK